MGDKDICAVVLAAGKGTRMRSDKPKVLQTLLGEPMLAYVIAALEPVFEDSIYVLAGHRAEMIREAFPEARIIIQEPQSGTGHALACALAFLEQSLPERIFAANGDCPLLTSELVRKFISDAGDADVAFATIDLENPGSYGRVVRKNGEVQAIIEAKDYQEEVYGPPSGEINSGLWLMRSAVAAKLLPMLSNSNASGEYYLTDLVDLALRNKLKVKGVQLGDNPDLLGINTAAELAKMENRLAESVNTGLMNAGVIIHHPAALRVSPFAQIEPGAELSGPSQIFGKSRVEKGAAIGPFCVVDNSHVGPDCKVLPFSHLQNAKMTEKASAGPFTRLRPGAVMLPNSRAGNFVELKNARLGEGAKANHLSYLGDADIGAEANIGAGTITCNYDGHAKHHTEIGKKAFIGSNSALVAPVTIGDGAFVGAGSVITKDVPADMLGLERNRQKNLPLRKTAQATDAKTGLEPEKK